MNVCKYILKCVFCPIFRKRFPSTFMTIVVAIFDINDKWCGTNFHWWIIKTIQYQ